MGALVRGCFANRERIGSVKLSALAGLMMGAEGATPGSSAEDRPRPRLDLPAHNGAEQIALRIPRAASLLPTRPNSSHLLAVRSRIFLHRCLWLRAERPWLEGGESALTKMGQTGCLYLISWITGNPRAQRLARDALFQAERRCSR